MRSSGMTRNSAAFRRLPRQRNRESVWLEQGTLSPHQGTGASVWPRHGCQPAIEIEMAEDAAPEHDMGRRSGGRIMRRGSASDLNQREYCEAESLSLKAFENWRAKFKAEPQLRARKLLYRRVGVSKSHPWSSDLSLFDTISWSNGAAGTGGPCAASPA